MIYGKNWFVHNTGIGFDENGVQIQMFIALNTKMINYDKIYYDRIDYDTSEKRVEEYYRREILEKKTFE
jgi:hypothetical protein